MSDAHVRIWIGCLALAQTPGLVLVQGRKLEANERRGKENAPLSAASIQSPGMKTEQKKYS